MFIFLVFVIRTHANGSIKRGSKDNATDAVQLRTGIGVQLKDIKVFNKARQQGGWVGGWVGATPEPANGDRSISPMRK